MLSRECSQMANATRLPVTLCDDNTTYFIFYCPNCKEEEAITLTPSNTNISNIISLLLEQRGLCKLVSLQEQQVEVLAWLGPLDNTIQNSIYCSKLHKKPTEFVWCENKTLTSEKLQIQTKIPKTPESWKSMCLKQSGPNMNTKTTCEKHGSLKWRRDIRGLYDLWVVCCGFIIWGSSVSSLDGWILKVQQYWHRQNAIQRKLYLFFIEYPAWKAILIDAMKDFLSQITSGLWSLHEREGNGRKSPCALNIHDNQQYKTQKTIHK